jgi:hypothetical protein
MGQKTYGSVAVPTASISAYLPPGQPVSVQARTGAPPRGNGQRPACVCGCDLPAASRSIYAAWACRARSKMRRPPAAAPSPAEVQRRLIASCIRRGTAKGKIRRTITRVIRTRNLAPVAPGASTPPQAGQKRRVPWCLCGCGKRTSASSGLYASTACRKRVARRKRQDGTGANRR